MDSKNTFSVVRHGKARSNELGIVSCKMGTQEQYELTTSGIETVEKEASIYTNFDYIYCSPFRRTQETASIFAQSSNCEVIVDARLKEFDIGDFDGEPTSVYDCISLDDTDYCFQNGESFMNVFRRVSNCVEDINDTHLNKNILIVTHGVPAEILVDWFNNKVPRKWDECIAKGRVFSLSKQ